MDLAANEEGTILTNNENIGCILDEDMSPPVANLDGIEVLYC